ncbi:hypothetical protein [Nonomuraea typhae]|uniref:hypothetical protein n=1 Tax=Nonomuraea typhae TaxID=2603600 RepID=UPI0012F883B9|nr:hypothetical protein [Nonomuraea typhae]
MTAFVRSSITGTGVGSSWTCQPPPGYKPGDQLIAGLVVDSGGVADLSPGWEWLGRISGDINWLSAIDVYWRTATAAEPTYTISQAETADGAIVIAALGNALGIPQVYGTEVQPATTAVESPSALPEWPLGLDLRIAAGVPNNQPVSWSTPLGYTLIGSAQSEDDVAITMCVSPLASTAPVDEETHFASNVLVYAGAYTVLVRARQAPVPQPPVVQPFAPGRGSSSYRYVFTRLLDRTYLGDLDLVNVAFDKRILQPGTLNAAIPIPSRKVGDQVAEIIPRDATELGSGPGVITCQIYREGEPWGEYWITKATPSRGRRGTPAIALQGSTLDAYLARVEIQDDLVFGGDDQIAIARGLLNSLLGQANANISLSLQAGTSGVVRDRTYLESEGGTYGQRLIELAQVDDGFEWMINLELVGGSLVRRWVWGYPTLGTLDPPPHLFADGRSAGDILDWSEEIDALRGATRWRARGSTVSTDASTTSTPVVSGVHSATAHLAAGWPRLDRTLSYSTVTQAATLDDYAAFWAAKAAGALRVDQATVALGKIPSLTPNNLGDAARFYLNNEWHRGEWRTRRIIGIGITPSSRDHGKEEARLVLEGQEAPGA